MYMGSKIHMVLQMGVTYCSFIGNYTHSQWILTPQPHPPSYYLRGENVSFELEFIGQIDVHT